METVYANLGIKPDFATRPYASIKELKDFRDALAHGKPADLAFDEEVLASPEELGQIGLMHAD